MQAISPELIQCLALVQTNASSLLEFSNQELKLKEALSNTTLFLVVQRVQQAVIMTSLKIEFPKDNLASIIISRGYRFRFQLMEILCQQIELNGHSKKRWKHVSSSHSSKKKCFLISTIAENTAIIIQMFVLSPQQVSGIQFVPDEKPKEKLVFTSPQPRKERGSFSVANQGTICFLTVVS